MQHHELSARERAVLFALLSQARKLSNAELRAVIGIPLEGKERCDLNDLKLVESEKHGRVFRHGLTDAGWKWCADELAAAAERAENSGRPGSSLERSYHLFFGVVARYLAAARLSVADLVSIPVDPPPEGKHVRRDASTGDGDLAARVTACYRELAVRPGEFVRLHDLRGRLPDVPRTSLDATLDAMFAAQRVNLVPRSGQQALTDGDRAAALRVGGEHKHLISIE